MASCLYIYINIYGMVGFYGILFIHIYKIYLAGLGFMTSYLYIYIKCIWSGWVLWHPVYTYI